MDSIESWIEPPPPPLSIREQDERLRAGIESAAPPPEPPRVEIVPGDLPITISDAEDALLASGIELFQSGGRLVRPGVCPVAVTGGEVTGLRLVEVGVPNLVELMTKAATWEKVDGRSGEWVRTNCPRAVAEGYAARVGQWKLRVLTGLIEAPTLRPDGSLLDKAGYDPATGLLLRPSCKVPRFKARPTRDDALTALALLTDLVTDFPFLDRGAPDHWPDRSVALSAILTALVRRSLPTAPLHGFSAPVAGSGKSMLVDIVSLIATGRRAAVISQGKTEEEFEKRLAGMILAGDALVSVDNCDIPLGGDLLCQALTQPTLKLRPLGGSVMVDAPSNAALFATGNNLTLRGDMTRRALVARLDPQCERPELRKGFRHDPLALITASRGKYIAAALTVLRAFHVAGRPVRLDPLGSFTDWSDLVRSALVWLGEADPCQTMDDTRAADPMLDALSAVLATWRKVIGLDRVTVSEVIRQATAPQSGGLFQSNPDLPEFREALLAVAGDGGAINGRRLGKWLGRNKDRIVDGMRIVQDLKLEGNVTWRLQAGDPGAR